MCPHCDKKFTQKGNLDAHLKTHSKEKPYPCGTCDKKFAHKMSLMSHFRQEHHMFEDVDELKQGYLKYSSSPSPSDSPVNHHNSSPGIPTPQSSLESMNGSGSLSQSSFNPICLPLNNGYPIPSPTDLSDLSKLSATVEATMRSHNFPPRSISSSSSASSWKQSGLADSQSRFLARHPSAIWLNQWISFYPVFVFLICVYISWCLINLWSWLPLCSVITTSTIL